MMYRSSVSDFVEMSLWFRYISEHGVGVDFWRQIGLELDIRTCRRSILRAYIAPNIGCLSAK